MPSRRRDSIIMEDVEILPGQYRNFAGHPTEYNRSGGVREFAVLLPERLAEEMAKDGLNVKHTQEYERDGEVVRESAPFLKIKVRFDILPPTVVLITSRNEQTLTERDVGMLDTANIIHTDMIVQPRDYENREGKPGVSVYLKSGYFTIEEDYLEEKYARRREERLNRERA